MKSGFQIFPDSAPLLPSPHREIFFVFSLGYDLPGSDGALLPGNRWPICSQGKTASNYLAILS